MLLTYLINGELMTSDQYMERFGVTYLRAIHEINALVNKAESTRSAASAGGLGTPKTMGGGIGGATDEPPTTTAVRLGSRRLR